MVYPGVGCERGRGGVFGERSESGGLESAEQVRPSFPFLLLFTFGIASVLQGESSIFVTYPPFSFFLQVDVWVLGDIRLDCDDALQTRIRRRFPDLC